MIYVPLALLIASVVVAIVRKELTAQLLALWAIGAALILPHVGNR